jgi:hypothetical protein
MYYILFALLIIFIVSITLYQKYNTIENFDPDHIFDKNVKIENFKGNTNLPIQNYIVKSSYNSSIDHQNYVSKDAIKYVLGRGCRFLDFEILYDPEKPRAALVGKVTGVNNDGIETKNTMLLDDICDTIVSYGFSKPTPNPNDPLFIHLRIKPLIKNNQPNTDIYNNVSSTITHKFKNYLYKYNIESESSNFNDIKNKLVVLVENNPDLELSDYLKFNFSITKRNSDKENININTYDEIVEKKHFDIEFSGTGELVKPNNIRIGVPEFSVDSNSVNEPSSYNLITNYATQINCFRFYNKSNNLKEYDELFNHFKSAFIILENGISYINRITKQ